MQSNGGLGLNAVESLTQVVYKVVGILDAYRQAYRVRPNALAHLIFGRELRVGRAGRMYHERLCVGHVCQQREYLEAVYKPESLLPAALDVEREDRACASVVVFL